MNTHPSGLSQADYAALAAKTDMRKIHAFIAKHGVAKWRELAKDATTQGWQTTTGAVFYDLRAPLYLMDQVYTPVLNSTPRWDKINAGYGIQPNWKAITNFDKTNVAPFVSEGNRNAYASVTEKNFSAPYVTLGSDDFVTFEAESASEGYDNNLGTAKEVQLLRFRRNQETTYLGGAGTLGANGNPLQLGTTPTPVAALNAAAAGGLVTGAYAACYCVALNYRAATNPGNTVTNGLTVQYGRVSADGSATDTINGGTAIVSAASNVAGPTTSPLPSVLFKVAPVAGAWGYAWFVQVNNSASFTPAPGSALLSAITTFSAFVYTGTTQYPAGTQAANYSGTGGYAGFSTDCSTNALDMDGLLTIASNSNYTTGLPTWSYPSGSSVTVLAGGVDLHGAGLTNGGMVGAVTEFDNALFAIQVATKTSPTRIYISTDVVNTFTQAFLVGATGSPQLNYFFPNGGQGNGGLAVETHIAKYFNKYALAGGAMIDVIHHPYLPTGTVLFDVNNLGIAYEHSRLGETRGVFVRRDTYGIDFAQTTRKYPFGVYSEEVLAVKAPQILGFIKSVGKFGATALF